jgi:putative ABC transport system substrate-binding protein
MRRRDFIAGFASMMTAWPFDARAQQSGEMRRIGVLMNVAPDHPEGKSRLAVFQQALQDLGWADGRNVRVEYSLVRYPVIPTWMIGTKCNSIE